MATKKTAVKSPAKAATKAATKTPAKAAGQSPAKAVRPPPVKSKKIALFNHKGGVSKTTTAFNLGWMLATKGYRVIMVDADPQCNLSGLVLGYQGQKEFENFYQNEPERNIRSGLAPAFESRPKIIEAIDCVAVKGNENLLLLPGHIRLSEYEVTLGIAQELSGSIQTLQNLPGAISYLLDQTGKKYNAHYILVDMNPSLSSINQNLLMTSDYFLVPTSPDYFSVMAIDSLSLVLPRWRAWAQKASGLPILKAATYPFPSTTPKFLGTIVQKYRIRARPGAEENEEAESTFPSSGTAAEGFRHWIDDIDKAVARKLVPALKDNGMMLPDDRYKAPHIQPNYCLAAISDFNSLIAKSQLYQTPIYALTDEQIGLGGVLLERTKRSRDMFLDIFDKLSDTIIEITGDEASS
jgi:cellulose biosynthesis protein BcsQ